MDALEESSETHQDTLWEGGRALVCTRISSILIVSLSVLSSSGCDESLPPRSEPARVVEASVSPPYSYIPIQDGNPTGTEGFLTASLRNIYDDALQKEAHLQGTIDVWIADNPKAHRTIRLTAGDLKHPSLDGKLLTLTPNDSARFLAAWDQRTDDGIPFWRFANLTHIENANSDYWDSDQIEFVAQASSQVFENVQPRTSPLIHYTTMYRLFGNIDAND